MNKPKIILPLFLILCIAAFLRFYNLGSIPLGIANDEVIRVMGAYTIVKTGGNGIDGSFLPLSATEQGDDFSPVSFYLSAPVTALFGVSLFTARFMYAVFGVLSVLMLYLLTRKLFTYEVGLLSAFVLAVSPWHLIVSRGVWDAGISLFFYLAALFTFLSYKGSRKILLSLPLFGLALYSYHGTIFFFILLIALLFALYHKDLLKRKKDTIFLTIGFVLLIIPFLLAFISNSLDRQNVLFWKSESTLANAAKQVDFERQKSKGYFVIRQVFNNKPMYFLREVSANYLYAYSPEYLFIRGDIGRINAYGKYIWGAMYLVELPFLLAGIYYIIKSKATKEKLLLAGVLAIAPITSALILEDRSYMFRSIMMLPVLSILVGLGVLQLWKQLQTQNALVVRIISIGTVILYLFFIGKHSFTYFYQYGIFGSEYIFKSSKDVSLYIHQFQNSFDTVYVVYPEKFLLVQFAFYNSIEPNTLQQLWKQDDKQYKNIRFIDECFKKEEITELKNRPENDLYVAPHYCEVGLKPVKRITDIEEPQRDLWRSYIL